jgi:hypothetical protein
VTYVGAPREEERHRHGHRKAEDGQKDEHRDRHGDQLACAEVLREDRIEVVLDRGLPRHVRRDAAAMR